MSIAIRTQVAPPPCGQDSLELAERHLLKVRRIALGGYFAPLPLLVLGFGGTTLLDRAWMYNPILSIILALFTLGQVMLFKHLTTIRTGAQRTLETLAVLKAAGPSPELEGLRDELARTKPGHTRDLALHWVEIGLQGNSDGAENLLENATERRYIRDHKLAGLHVSINRTILKVGFLGTLMGLLFTFPPMKRAILGLSSSNGEMAFIRDIAKAIDEDGNAILATLVSVAFSMLLETVVVQALERMLIGFDLSDRHLADWNITCLQNAVRKHKAQMQAVQGASPVGWPTTRDEMDARFKLLMETVGRCGETIETLARTQDSIARRVTDLTAFEKRYRDFVAAKASTLTPDMAKDA
jgi:hypothetical protein